MNGRNAQSPGNRRRRFNHPARNGNPDHETSGDRDRNAVRHARRRTYLCWTTLSVGRLSQSCDDRRPRHQYARVFCYAQASCYAHVFCDAFAGRFAAAGKRSSRRDGRAHDRDPGAAPCSWTPQSPAAAMERRKGRTRRSPPRSPPPGNGAVICVAEGTYAEQLKPGEKIFTLAGGFQRGKDFKVRDSAAYVTKATGTRRIVHSHRRSRPQGQPAHRHRRFRHQRLFAGDRPRLLRVAAVRHHEQPHPRQQVRQRRAGRRRLCPEQRLGPDRGQRVQEQFLRPWRRGLPERLHQGEHGHDRAQPDRRQCRHRARHLARRGALSLRQDAADHRQPVHAQQRDPMGRRPLRRRRPVQRPAYDGEPELERLSGQPRRQRRRRHVLRRRRHLPELSRGLRQELRRQHPARQRLAPRPRPSRASVS